MRIEGGHLTPRTGPRTAWPARLADLRAALGLEDASEDLRLRAILAAVGAALAGTHGLRRDPWRLEVVERLVGPGGPHLYPSRWPIEEVFELEVGATAIAPADVEVVGRRRDALYREAGWPRSDYPVVRLLYVAGWLAPEDVVDWQPGLAVEAGTWVRPADSRNLLRFEAASDGVTGETMLAWPTTAGQMVVDGTVTWTARAASEQPEDVTQAALLTAVQWARGDLDIPFGIVAEGDASGRTQYRQDMFGPVPPIAMAVWGGYR